MTTYAIWLDDSTSPPTVTARETNPAGWNERHGQIAETRPTPKAHFIGLWTTPENTFGEPPEWQPRL